MLDKAFEALKTYDWGVDPKAIRPIDEAIVATHGDTAKRKELETKLDAVLDTDIPQAAKDAVCRALRTIGTAASVPALAKLLSDEKLSHMARYALEPNPSPEATKALVDAMQKGGPLTKIGVASSLGARGKDVPVAPLAALLGDKDPAVQRAGALALGSIGSAEAAKALSVAKANDAAAKTAVADGLLKCAENMLAAGNKAGAKATYQKVLESKPSASMKTAADLGLASSS